MVSDPLDVATQPELICYNWLQRIGLVPDVDFLFQTSVFGGRLDRGGLVVDFWFNNPPDLAVAVQGEYFHYTLRGGTRFQDLMAREELALQGTTLVFIDEEDLLSRPEYIVREALEYRDHSKIARGT